ncbi:DUF2256 domain-containing protein [Nisaea acidiphila]|uniref:DUF2256 domain-containing protein n=1 Tax=Nisaea acidiphila TaxID=1862145 RepID=A0A9J7AN30_9PROT|nr:DUF2256 domain-containing protein [Nisaea acidiphila]UUX48574.1 DUF2256 domain-containing protein [Nisaea acidiphila]
MRMRRKGELPEKLCPVCKRSFAWRRKWARVWDEVRYCSERCRQSKRNGRQKSVARNSAALSR